MTEEQKRYRREVFQVVCLAIVSILIVMITAMALGIDGKVLAAGVGMIGMLAGGFGGFTVKQIFFS